jgi:hypothetical protein
MKTQNQIELEAEYFKIHNDLQAMSDDEFNSNSKALYARTLEITNILKYTPRTAEASKAFDEAFPLMGN